MTSNDCFENLIAHLQEVKDDPSKSLNVDLLGEIDWSVSESIEESWRDRILNQIADLLPKLQQDPTPLTHVIERLISPESYNFDRVLTIRPPVDFAAGLLSPLPPIHFTTLALLDKASFRRSDTELVAGMGHVVAALVKLWLATPYTVVAERARDLIVDLLLADKEEDAIDYSTIIQEGLMWRRILRDRDIYESIFSICSLSTAGPEGQLSREQKTTSQARLLEMLLKIDSDPVRSSQIPEIEQRFGVMDGGLLHFAAIHMVDYEDDVLMHMTLIKFYADFLGTGDTFALDFLRRNGLHTRSMESYLGPAKHDELDWTLLYGASADYVATYCSKYLQDLLSTPTLGHILWHLIEVLEEASTSWWAPGRIPKHDFRVMMSLPRVMLLPRPEGSSVLLSIRVKPGSPDAFDALAHFFHGSDEGSPEENAAARVLYFLEMKHVSSFWADVVVAADIVTLKESALSANYLIGAVITARWSPLLDDERSGSGPFKLPSERELARICHARSLPRSGMEAILTQPAHKIVLQYLLKPPQTFGSSVGRGRGDAEGAVYQIAAAKHDVLKLLHQELKACVGTSGNGGKMVEIVERLVALGPMRGANEAGDRVGTMEQ